MTKAQLNSVVIPKMCKLLEYYGWFPVATRKSGCFFKNGCVLTFGSEYSTVKDYEEGCLPSVKHNYTESDVVTRNGWMIEKDGYLIATDSLPASIVQVLVTDDYSENPKILELLKRINSYADMGFTELASICMNHQMIETTTTANILQECGGKLRDTMMVKCLTNTEKLSSGYYKIVDSDDTGMNFVRVQQKEDYSIAIGRVVYRLETPEVIKLFKDKVMKIAAYAPAKVTVYKDLVLRVAKHEYRKLPEEFYRLGLNNEQLKVLGYAIGKAANLIPLLNKKVNCSFEFVDALTMAKSDLSRLAEVAVTKDTESMIANIIMTGLNLDKFVMNYDGLCDYESLEMTLHDFDLDYSDFIGSVQQADMNAEAEKSRIAKIMFSYGERQMTSYSGKNGYAEFYGKQYGIRELMIEMMNTGTSTENGYRMFVDSHIDRTKLFTFFAIPGAEVANGVVWNELLTGFINELQYIEWTTQNGLMIQTHYGRLGRDDNGIIFFYSNGVPRVRSISVKGKDNEKTFFYGENILLNNISDSHMCIGSVK